MFYLVRVKPDCKRSDKEGERDLYWTRWGTGSYGDDRGVLLVFNWNLLDSWFMRHLDCFHSFFEGLLRLSEVETDTPTVLFSTWSLGRGIEVQVARVGSGRRTGARYLWWTFFDVYHWWEFLSHPDLFSYSYEIPSRPVCRTGIQRKCENLK